MLSWSGKAQGTAVDLRTMTGDVDQLARVRERVTEALGEATMVDAAAVIANFEMMTRLAEATGAVLHNMASVRAGTEVGADVFKQHD